jgi:isocitrate/isopropylmalate dehydrogenase
MASPLADPTGVDLVIVRENLEDMYLFLEGPLSDLAPLDCVSPTAKKRADEMGDGSYALKVITEQGTERICRYAFELARRRRADGRAGRVTVSAKTNMLPRTDGLFVKTAERLSADYPEIELERFIVDDFAHRLVANPGALDVVLLPNLYGDILSDAAAGLAGGLGLAPSGCYGAGHAYFESAHGTADDIEGLGIINPTASLLSGAMMLEHLGYAEASKRLEEAIASVYASGLDLTPDQGGTGTTDSFSKAVIAAAQSDAGG